MLTLSGTHLVVID